MKLTAKQYFDKLVKTSAEGGFPCRNGLTCKYRFQGKACGVGIIMPDEVYDPIFDNADDSSITILQGRYPGKLKLQEWCPTGLDLYDLKDIQTIHDHQGSPWNHQYFVDELMQLRCFSYANSNTEEGPKENNGNTTTCSEGA